MGQWHWVGFSKAPTNPQDCGAPTGTMALASLQDNLHAFFIDAGANCASKVFHVPHADGIAPVPDFQDVHDGAVICRSMCGSTGSVYCGNASVSANCGE
jgi:hypothetical protein